MNHLKKKKTIKQYIKKFFFTILKGFCFSLIIPAFVILTLKSILGFLNKKKRIGYSDKDNVPQLGELTVKMYFIAF